MEEHFVKEIDGAFQGVFSGKLRRYFDWKNFADIFKIMGGFFQSIWILAKFRPSVVFTKGGFVTVPVGIAAWILRIPLIIHESDLTPGLANRILMPFAKKVCVSFEETLKYVKNGVFTGNPLRQSLIPKDKKEQEDWKRKAYAETGFDPKLPLVLVLGGSSGSQSLNEKMVSILNDLKDVQVVLQTGKGKQAFPKTTDQRPQTHLRQYEYLDEESQKYLLQVADVVVSRAGAGSLFELASLGKALIAVPLGMRGSRGDQIRNAEIFENSEAILVHKDEDSASDLLHKIHNILENSDLKRQLEKNIRTFSMRGSTEKVVEELFLQI